MRTYCDLSIQDYHNHKDIPSRSALLQALKSPAHLRRYLDGKIKKNDSMRLGTFIHEFIENGLQIPSHWNAKQELYQRTTNGRPAGSPKLDEDGNPLFSYENLNNPDDSLTPAKSVLAVSMMDAIENDLFIARALQLPDIIIEPTYFGLIKGRQVKTRPDIAYTDDGGHLIEIKTVSSLDESDISREFFEYGYDIQLFLELELSGAESVTFYFVSAETPSGIARHTVDRNSLWYKLGKQRAELGLELFYNNKDTAQTSYNMGDINVPISYKAANYIAKNGIEE